MMQSPLGRLRIISLVEGISFLVLLGIAMPLKYAWGMPWAVSVIGMIHGVLFLLFCIALVNACFFAKWNLKPPFLIFLASIIPFAPFWVEKWLRKQHAEVDRDS
ncbi:MAG: hypothetical protein CMJ24_11770 [Phycisphaerae bacterium]|jgi:integral membrane protein|nr:hypothetical protein [Phycisphaerae bacterium]MDG1898480.1 DUF3817 domain-containing protein [Phycisphaerales bacterium]|tara:strand:- start:55 stop:366 length:312 start_codon:yes stop_codon:yes gene_type:complete